MLRREGDHKELRLVAEFEECEMANAAPNAASPSMRDRKPPKGH